MRTTIEIIQKVRTFLNFGWVEKREKRRRRNPTTGSPYDGQDEAPPCDALPKTMMGYF
jgi:hypothetical protein